MSLFIKNIFLVQLCLILAILYPTSLANLVVEVGTRHSHQTLLLIKIVFLIIYTSISVRCRLSPNQYKELYHERLKNFFIMSWMTDIRNWWESSSILKIYILYKYKMNFGTECYLKHVSKPKFRITLSKARASSHDLEVERGRYVRPKLNIKKHRLKTEIRNESRGEIFLRNKILFSFCLVVWSVEGNKPPKLWSSIIQ